MNFLKICLAILVLTTAGCAAQGRFYAKVTSPYSTYFHGGMPVGSKVCRIGEHQIKEPISGAGVSVNWTARVIQEAARKASITNLYYADLETLSIANGVYKRRTLIVYGD